MRSGQVIFLSGTNLKRGKEMSNKLEKQVKQIVMAIFMVFVLGLSIKAVHDEYQNRQQQAEDKTDLQTFFAWRGK